MKNILRISEKDIFLGAFVSKKKTMQVKGTAKAAMISCPGKAFKFPKISRQMYRNAIEIRKRTRTLEKSQGFGHVVDISFSFGVV